MAQLVTETYAGALFEVGIETENLEEIFEDYKAVVDVLKHEPDFFEVFKTPKITNDEKKRIFDEIFRGKVSAEMLNFMKVLIDKRRAYSFIGIFEAFEKIYRKHLNIATANVKSVVALSDSQAEILKKQLEQLTGYQIELENEIDETIVGGLFIQIGDRIIDNTVRRKISDLKDLLVERVV